MDFAFCADFRRLAFAVRIVRAVFVEQAEATARPTLNKRLKQEAKLDGRPEANDTTLFDGIPIE